METEVADSSRGNLLMVMHLGIGKTRQTAKWLGVSGSNLIWNNSPTDFRITYNNTDGNAFIVSSEYMWGSIPVPSTYSGLIFVDFLSTNYGEETSVDVADFSISVENVVFTHETDGIADKESNADYQEYESTNANNVRNEWNADCIYASENNLPFGYGMLMNGDGTFMRGIHNVLHRAELQEEWLAECVTLYWAQAKRKIETEMRSNITCSLSTGGTLAIGKTSPINRVAIDSTTFSPIAISHSWRDDVTKLVLMEIPA